FMCLAARRETYVACSVVIKTQFTKKNLESSNLIVTLHTSLKPFHISLNMTTEEWEELKRTLTCDVDVFGQLLTVKDKDMVVGPV
ncbi:hypothetical protein PFISCL1PPCAC_4179, partial [Pristionchus fissidentatus]